MSYSQKSLSKKQELYRSMLVGVLIYSVVLGFYNDYTDILDTGTYSTTFALALLLQILTYATFRVKDWVVARAKAVGGSNQRVYVVGGVWAVMFISKFVFLGIISIVFRDNVYISGFIGLLLIIITMTVLDYLVAKVDKKLEA